MAVGEKPASKAQPAHSVGFVDTQRAEALARAFETISHVSGGAARAGRRRRRGAALPLALPSHLCNRPSLAASRSPTLQALETDVVGVYLSQPGSQHPFHHAVFSSYLAAAPQMVLQCADYGCGPPVVVADGRTASAAKKEHVCGRTPVVVSLMPLLTRALCPSPHPLPQLLRHHGGGAAAAARCSTQQRPPGPSGGRGGRGRDDAACQGGASRGSGAAGHAAGAAAACAGATEGTCCHSRCLLCCMLCCCHAAVHCCRCCRLAGCLLPAENASSGLTCPACCPAPPTLTGARRGAVRALYRRAPGAAGAGPGRRHAAPHLLAGRRAAAARLPGGLHPPLQGGLVSCGLDRGLVSAGQLLSRCAGFYVPPVASCASIAAAQAANTIVTPTQSLRTTYPLCRSCTRSTASCTLPTSRWEMRRGPQCLRL